MLTLKNLKAGYNGKTVVDIPDFTLRAGERSLLLGRSGSGKTTLLYAIAGLLTPLSGDIRLDAVSLPSLSAAERDRYRGRHIGIIYQTLHMVAALTVLQNLLLVQYSAGLTQNASKAEALLEKVGLADHRHKKPAELSQGQQQRVAIVRAAMTEPALILADEPTSALDDVATEAVMRLLLDTVSATNACLIVATHDARIKPHFPHTLTLGEQP